ncbi:MAG TPA: hypothetical protein VL356_09940 [Acidocella sp.]|jgi:hypothetical protein|nr:hypothetical protein [Acidocella sp.]
MEMKLDKTATRDDKNGKPKAPPAVDAPKHQSQANTTGSGAEQRRDKRQQLVGLNLLAPRTRLIFDTDGKDVQVCRIRDVSEKGYRIALTREREIPIGTEIMLEHTDGWRRPVRVCWASGAEFGLEIIGVNTRVILDAAGKDVHACEILAVTDTGYRITVATQPKMVGNFLLELANGSRRKVRVRWSYRNEFGLQLVDTAPRPGFRG